MLDFTPDSLRDSLIPFSLIYTFENNKWVCTVYEKPTLKSSGSTPSLAKDALLNNINTNPNINKTGKQFILRNEIYSW